MSPTRSPRDMVRRWMRPFHGRVGRAHMLVPERRQGLRFLTLKNAAIAGLAIVAAFLLLSIWSELRPSRSHASGSLFESPVQSSPSRHAPREPVAAILEGSIRDQPPTGAILVDAEPAPAANVPSTATSTPPVHEETFEPRESQLGKGRRITISGGTTGVGMRVETAPATAPTSETAAPAQPVPPPPSD